MSLVAHVLFLLHELPSAELLKSKETEDAANMEESDAALLESLASVLTEGSRVLSSVLRRNWRARDAQLVALAAARPPPRPSSWPIDKAVPEKEKASLEGRLWQKAQVTLLDLIFRLVAGEEEDTGAAHLVSSLNQGQTKEPPCCVENFVRCLTPQWFSDAAGACRDPTSAGLVLRLAAFLAAGQKRQDARKSPGPA